jgi:hypothetical protein
MNNIIDQFNKDFDFYGFEYEESDLEVKWVANEALTRDIDPLLQTFDPDEIAEVYYFRNGTNDEESWVVIGRLKNGLYFYFESSCDYTGFDCQGGAEAILAYEWASLKDYGLCETVREQIENGDGIQEV